MPWAWILLTVLAVLLAIYGADSRGDAASAGELQGVPTRIVDGDTFELAGARIRLHGVDAPEMDTTAGPLARQAMMGMIAGRSISCRDTGARSYDRVVARCEDPDGADLSGRMVAEGWAVDAPRFSGGRYQLQQWRAQIDGRGMYAN